MPIKTKTNRLNADHAEDHRNQRAVPDAQSGDGSKMLFTVGEVAHFFRCGVTTVWRWAKEGKIPQPIRIGGVTRWKLDEIQACIAAAEAQRDTTH
jgi:predicted DNA-binding transcriptional regulator AlpA